MVLPFHSHAYVVRSETEQKTEHQCRCLISTNPIQHTHNPESDQTTRQQMESDECETHQQRFQHMPSGVAFGSHLGGRGETDGGMLEDDEELQRLERALEGSMEGVEAAESNFLAKARHGLASLKQSLSGGGQEEGDKADVPIGRKGYGADPPSELEQGMHSEMQEAAKLLMDTTVHLKGDAPHLHAPELFHPEAVTSYEEMGAGRWAEGATGALDVGRMMKAAMEATETMKGEIGSFFEGRGGESQGQRRSNSLANDAAAVVGEKHVGVLEGGGGDEKTEEGKEGDEEEMLEMLQMFTPE